MEKLVRLLSGRNEAGKADQTTVVIPTFNRHSDLRRLLFTLDQSPRYLYVLDSSDVTTARKNQDICRGRPNVKYFGFAPEIRLIDKLHSGLLNVDTPNVIFCPDDDLIFEDGLSAAERFLAESPSHVAVDGISLAHHRTDRTISIEVDCADLIRDYSDAFDRVHSLLSNYRSFFYALLRTTSAKSVVNACRGIDSLHYQELFQSVATCLKGRVTRLPVILTSRQQTEPADPSRKNWQTFEWFFEDRASFVHEYLVYRAALIKFHEAHLATVQGGAGSHEEKLDIAHIKYFSVGFSKLRLSNKVDYAPLSWEQNRGQESLLNHRKSSMRNFLLRSFTIILEEITRIANQKAVPGLLIFLNWKVRARYGPGFSCVFPGGETWLAHLPEFHRCYDRLSKYYSDTSR